MFPTADPDTLTSLNWIETATDALLNGIKESCEKQNSLSGYTGMAADIAIKSTDKTVIGIRTGTAMTNIETHFGCDTIKVAVKIVGWHTITSRN